jgi:surface protein
MEYMFYSNGSFDNNGQPLSWNTSSLTQMNSLFAFTQFNQDISGWNTSNVTNMSAMFYGASQFNRDISGWNVLNIVNGGADLIFCNCPMSTLANASKRPKITYPAWISSCI